MTDAIIQCANVSKVFKDFWLRDRVKAVTDVSFHVRRGEVFGLLGPNGSGKSTTIKMILGLLRPTSGRISVFGKDPQDVATKKRIGYLPEESYLYRFLNARETLDYYGRLFHLPADVRSRRIDMLLDMVGLDTAQHRRVGEYSKGMQRRIGLAQALINQPQLLILDEPTTGMDPIGTRQIKDLIVRLKDKGITILLCSHLLADVEDVCDRVTIMFGGRVIEEGTLDELLVDHGMTTIEAANLDDQTIEQIERVLEKHGRAIEKVSHRRQTLEKKFLDLVERERLKGSATSGATSGGRIADFLLTEERAGHLPEDAQAAAILNELTKPAAPAKADALQQQPPQPADSQPQVDTGLLSQLSGAGPAVPAAGRPRGAEPDLADRAAAPQRAAEPAPQEDLSVLSGLVGPAVPASQPPKAPAPNPSSTAPLAAKRPMQPAPPDASIAAPSSVHQETFQRPAEPALPAPQPPVAPQLHTPRPSDPPQKLVSKESGESGLGLMFGVTSEEDALQLPPIDPPPKPKPPRSAQERPDASFLEAIKNVEPAEDDDDAKP
jgi:ABC-2 type transport system ATP-binding protein